MCLHKGLLNILFLVPGVMLLGLNGLWAQVNDFNNALALTEGPVRVIFDTDMGPDFDDAGALAVLHALEDHGKAEILATVSSNKLEGAVPVIDVINTYFGHPDIPIGAPKGKGITMGSDNHWNRKISKIFPHNLKSSSNAPDAVDIYRKVLAIQPDSSVVIVTVGFITNLADLLKSESDENSPLNGKQLVAQKVKRWVCMGGGFPKGQEFNLKTDAGASYYAINNWPTPILFSGFNIGKKIKTGNRLVNNGSKDNPVRMVYEYCLKTFQGKVHPEGRMSWDQTAVLAAVNGVEEHWEINKGKIVIRKDGSNGWKNVSGSPFHAHLVEKSPPEKMASIIENLMMHEP